VWQHVAATFDINTQEMAIYVNGIEAASSMIDGASATLGSIYDSNTPVRMGTFINALGGHEGFWDGRIDEVEVFSRALSVSEIQAVFHAGGKGSARVCR